jgi:hypothetical protein
LCPTALSAGPIHIIRGLYLPALVRPQGLVTLATVFSRPNLAGLVSDRLRSWALPFRGCSRLRWNGIPAAPHRRVVSSPSAGSCKHVRTAGSATSRVCPARVPVARMRVLPRTLARASPGFFLSEACPSTGSACSSANLRPRACSPSGYPGGAKLPLGVLTAGRPSSSTEFAGQSRQTPDLATGGGPRNLCEV